MSPSLTAGLPGGSRAGFTSGGVVLHVRGLKQYTNGLKQAGKTTQLFGKTVQLKSLTKSQKNLLAFQNGLLRASNALLKAGVVAAAAGAAIAAGIGVAAIKTAADVQQLTFALQGLVAIEIGKEQRAKGLIVDMSEAMEQAAPIAVELRDRLRDVALESPIQYEQIFAALRLQLAYGATAQATTDFSERIRQFGLDMEKAESPALSMAEAISQVGAVLARDSATFERLNYNLAQAILKGDLTAKNMRELRNAGLSLEDVFKSELNMTLEETREALKNGTIATEDLQVAFIAFADRYFAPAAERMTQSLRGVINNFKDLWAFAATDVMTPMLEEITIKLNEWFDTSEALLQQGVFKSMGEDLARATSNVIAFAEGITHVNIGWATTTVKVLAFAAATVLVSGKVVQLINWVTKLNFSFDLFALKTEIWAKGGLYRYITSLISPVTLFTAALGIAAVAIFAVVTAHKEHQKALDKEAKSILDQSGYYSEYVTLLEEAELGNRKVTAAVYDLIKAREAEGRLTTEEDLNESAEATELFAYNVGDLADRFVKFGVAQNELTVPILKVVEWVEKEIAGMDELGLTMLTNAKYVEELGKNTHLSGQTLRAFVATTVNAAKKELVRIQQSREAATSYERNNKLAEEHIAKLKEEEEETEDLIAEEKEQIKTLKDLEKALEEVVGLYEDWGNALSDAVGEIRDASDTAAGVHQDYADEIKDINSDLADDYADIAKKYDDSLPDPTSVEERTGQIVDVWDEWALRMAAIQEVGGPGEDLDQEAGWLADIHTMLDGTEFAMRDGVENAQGWMMRLREAFYEGKLPPEFYNTDNALYQDWVAKKNAAQEEETRVANEEATKRREIAEAELLAAQELAEQERQDAIVKGALGLAESTKALENWAQETQGAMWMAYDSADEVFEALMNGTLELTPELQALITNYAGGLVAVSGTAKGEAEQTKDALSGVVEEAESLGASIPALQAEYERLKDAIGWTTGGTGGRGGMSGLGAELMSEEDKNQAITRMQEIQTQLEALGVTAGAEFPTVADDMQAATDAIMDPLISKLADLGVENAQVAADMVGQAPLVAQAWHDAMFGNSVVPDIQEAMVQSQTAWDGFTTHMIASMVTTWATVKGTWKTGVDDVKKYLDDLIKALDPMQLKLQEIKDMDPIEVTIKITVEASPKTGLAEGTQKVDDLSESLAAVPTDIGVAIRIDLPDAERIGAGFGSQLVASISAASTGGKKTHGRWWDFTLNLFEPGKRLAGLADNFAKRWTDVELPQFQERISEIDKLIKEGNITEEERNALMEERLQLQDDMVANEETMLGLEKARADIDFLRQQVDLLELIRNHGLNAQEILGDITLGIDASAAELMTVTTRALEQLVAQIHGQLQIASPSKVMMEVGRFMMLGMGEGIAAAASIPVEAAQSKAIAPIVATGQMAPMNVTMNNTINNGIDQVVFENRVLDIIRRGVRGY